jgi:AcrR family transcriptional regulator
MRARDENKEAVIREKAFEIVVKHGFDGLSMHKLAKAAGVSPATIYIYYESREDLLNKLFMYAQRSFAKVALEDFSPDMSLEAGLLRQWKNRLKFIEMHPNLYRFFDQFRNSPLVNHKDVNMNEFKENMQRFAKNAVAKGEMDKMEPEIFWSVAYGTFYSLVKFHLDEKKMMNENFRLTEAKMKQALKLVVKALKPKLNDHDH